MFRQSDHPTVDIAELPSSIFHELVQINAILALVDSATPVGSSRLPASLLPMQAVSARGQRPFESRLPSISCRRRVVLRDDLTVESVHRALVAWLSSQPPIRHGLGSEFESTLHRSTEIHYGTVGIRLGVAWSIFRFGRGVHSVSMD